MSGVGSDLSMKIPFIVMREGPENDSNEYEGVLPIIGSSNEISSTASSSEKPDDIKETSLDQHSKEQCQQSEHQLVAQLHNINIDMNQQFESVKEQPQLTDGDQQQETSTVNDA